eukprot:5772907-Prymnesium_polylepis.2
MAAAPALSREHVGAKDWTQLVAPALVCAMCGAERGARQAMRELRCHGSTCAFNMCGMWVWAPARTAARDWTCVGCRSDPLLFVPCCMLGRLSNVRRVRKSDAAKAKRHRRTYAHALSMDVCVAAVHVAIGDVARWCACKSLVACGHLHFAT